MYNAAEYPTGVPNPWVGEVNSYPNLVHGPDYTRPVFTTPFMVRPHNVLSGLGLFEEYEAEKRAAFWKGVGAAAGTGLLLALVGAGNRKMAVRAAVGFGIVGAIGAGVTYGTWPKVGL